MYVPFDGDSFIAQCINGGHLENEVCMLVKEKL